MAEHTNVERLKKGYTAFASGDLDTLRDEVFASDIVWHVSGNSPIAGDYKGVDEVFGFFGKIFELSGGSFSLEVHDLLANDEHAIALAHATGSRDGGKTLDENVVHVYHVNDEGKVTEFWGFSNDSAVTDEFWS